MKVIIVGVGKLGFSMAKMLTAERHDVIIIEEKTDRVKLIDDLLDVQTIIGDGGSSSVLESAGIKKTDMFLAVTQSDEFNMVACLKAKHYGVKIAVARVSNIEYLEKKNAFLTETMQIDLMLNPEQVTATEIAQIVKNPEALQVDYYADGKVQMNELLVSESSPINGKQMKDLKIDFPFNIISIKRNHTTIVPRGNDQVFAGDTINVMAKTTDMLQVEKELGFFARKVERIGILGGGRTGYYLAKILESQKPAISSIKVIEKSKEQAEIISAKMQQSLIINGDGCDFELLTNENIGLCDMFLAVTNDDQVNILSCLMAKSLGAKKVITQINRPDLIHLSEQMGIDVSLSPRILSAGAILKFIRRGEIISVTVMDESAELIELLAQPGSSVINKKLMEIYFPPGSLVGAIVRGDQVIIPDGQIKINIYDRVMIFCLTETIAKVEKMFMGTGPFYD